LNEILRILAKEVLVPLILKRLIAQLPFLGWPIIGPIASIALNWIVGKVVDELALFIDFTAIAFRNDKARREFDRAGIALSIIAEQKGVESNEFKEAREQYKNALSDLVVHVPG